ncbi:MAG: lipocalin family protein [Pyrinomonadaceae bacterium]
MKTPNLNLILLSAILLASNALAQTAKFDIVTYSAPAGWAVEKDAGSLRFTKESGTNYCVISLTKAVDSIGDSGKNFEILWKAMAADGLNATATPDRGKQGEKDGWQAEAAVAPFEKDGLKGAVILTTFTGNEKVVAILAISNSVSFQKDIETFVDNVKLPPIAAQKLPAAPVAANTGDAAKLIGRWQRSGSSHPTYADPASWGTAGYTTSRYEFKPDGTYIYTERSFRMMMQNIIVAKENGRYTVSGNTLTITPAKSTISSYKKAGGVDALGAVVSTQNRKLETISYKFAFHYFEGIQEWNLVLQADTPTQRDGPFSGNTTFNNAWYFDQKYTNTDLTAVRAN